MALQSVTKRSLTSCSDCTYGNKSFMKTQFLNLQIIRLELQQYDCQSSPTVGLNFLKYKFHFYPLPHWEVDGIAIESQL